MQQKSIFEKELSPFYQLFIVLGIAFVLMIFSSLMPRPQNIQKVFNMPWIIICGMLLFYAMFNSVLSFASVKRDSYWWQSLASFAILMIAGSFMAYGFSGITMDEAGSIRWIYFVFTFGYLVFLSIVNLIRFLTELAQKKDKMLRGEE